MNTIYLTGIKNVAQSIQFNLEDDASTNIVACPVFQQVDCKISKDGGAFASVTATAAVVDNGAAASMATLALAAAETNCSRAVIHVIDAVDGPDWKEAQVIIEFSDPEYDEAIYVDSSKGTASAIRPYGTAKAPTTTIDNGATIADNEGRGKIKIRFNGNDTQVVGSANSLDYIEVVGYGTLTKDAKLNLNALSQNGATFRNMKIAGNSGEGKKSFFDCILEDGAEMGASRFERCFFEGSIKPIPEDPETLIRGCDFDYNTGELDCASISTNSFHVLGGNGYLKLTGMTTAGKVYIFGFNGEVVVDATCTAGTIIIYGGKVKLTDSSGSSCTVTHRDSDPTVAHGAGSWVAGGTSIRDNSRLKNLSYDTAGSPTYFEEWLYGSAADAAADTNSTKQLGIWTTYVQSDTNKSQWDISSRLIKDIT